MCVTNVSLIYKPGVVVAVEYVAADGSLRWLGPHWTLRDALEIARRVYLEAEQDLVVTEVFGGRHTEHSFHYIGRAADLRTNNLRADIRSAVLAKLGTDLKVLGYQVIFEGDHAHIEPFGARADFPYSLAVIKDGRHG